MTADDAYREYMREYWREYARRNAEKKREIRRKWYAKNKSNPEFMAKIYRQIREYRERRRCSA